MFYPMFAMVVLTFIVAGFTFRARMSAARQGRIDLKYFRLMRGDGEVPESVVKTGRHFSNLFEVPVLFYAAGMLYIIMELQSGLALALAWAFVLFRCLHAFIHIGYNNVMHRLAAFMAGNLCVLALWVVLLVHSV